jgi:hypothetical protein
VERLQLEQVPLVKIHPVKEGVIEPIRRFPLFSAFTGDTTEG